MKLIVRVMCALTVSAAAACSQDTSVFTGSDGDGSAGGDGGGEAARQNDATVPTQDGASVADVVPEASMGADVAIDAGDASDGAAGADGVGGLDGATITASCAGTMHPLCIDFEDGKADPPWVLPATNATIETGNAAHGRYAMHLSNLGSIPKNGSGQPQIYLHAPMQGFKDVMWGRFYLYMDPGAPDGHGALVRANDIQTNWDEVGFETNSYFGDWHTGVVGNPEMYERSKVVIPQKKWACVEFFFDGATPALPRIWGDGTEVALPDVGGPATTVQKAVQFVSFEIGIVFYHGGSLVSYGDDTPPYITDEWIDDVAVDTTRVGCL